MTIGSDYPTPVIVNGFSCKNCTDVDYAKKHIDPEHPKSGPYGINAKDDPTVKNAPVVVSFGGNLSSFNEAPAGPSGDAANETKPNAAIGGQLDTLA